MTQPSTPFAERAAQRCECPRRSSTRQSSSVVPSGSSVAPALKTVCTGYGQSAAVRIGIAVAAAKERLVAIAADHRVGPALTATSISAGCGDRDLHRVPAHFVGAHVHQREQERERRLRALVLVHPVGVQPVAAAAGQRVVERLLQLVLSEKPGERAPRVLGPAMISGRAERVHARRDRRAGLDRLLIERPPRSCRARRSRSSRSGAK